MKKDLEVKLVEICKGVVFDLVLVNVKVRNLKVVKVLLDNDKLELIDEGLKGFDE